MDVIIISGFLGSGKTTLLLRMAKMLVGRGLRLAIIENEVGKVGVDDQAIQEEGLAVKELFSGCICCSLRMDLVRTLLELERTQEPDIVIIEPSGVAGPHLVLDALQGYGGEIGRKIVMLLMDATRPALLLGNPPVPIVERGIEVGDLILINKIDKADPGSVSLLQNRILEIRPDARIATISASTGDGIARISSFFDETADAGVKKESAIPAAEGGVRTDSDAAVFSEKISFTFDPPLGREEVAGRLGDMLESLRTQLKNDGCGMIGHIKAILRDEERAGYLLMSITDFEGVPDRRGALSPESGKVSLTLNAIVYGMDPVSLAFSARPMLQSFKP